MEVPGIEPIRTPLGQIVRGICVVRISADNVVLGVLAILGIYDGMRVLRLPVFVAEPLGSGAYLIGLSSILLGALVVETAFHPLSPEKAKAGRTGGFFPFFRHPEIQAWLALILYSALLQAVGYFLSTLLYLLLSLRIFGERRWVWVLSWGGALTLFFYFLFKRLAGIPLP